MHKIYETTNIFEKAIGKARQIAARGFSQSWFVIPKDFRAVSFCFDDFPVSAGDFGAKTLEDAGARGTFYTCFGLLETETQGGKLASLDQVLSLSKRGHEIACHTYDHINCSFVGVRSVEMSCRENIKAAANHNLKLKNFSYPQGGMSLATKKIMQDKYASARSGFHGINRGACDAHCLKSVSFYEAYAAKINDLIDDVAQKGGWLILYTHDIADNPSEHGVSGTTFKAAIAHCLQKQISIQKIETVLSRESQHVAAG